MDLVTAERCLQIAEVLIFLNMFDLCEQQT